MKRVFTNMFIGFLLNFYVADIYKKYTGATSALPMYLLTGKASHAHTHTEPTCTHRHIGLHYTHARTHTYTYTHTHTHTQSYNVFKKSRVPDLGTKKDYSENLCLPYSVPTTQ